MKTKNYMALVGFLAKKRCGKDTSSDYLVEKHSFTKMTFAEPIKDASRILFGFSEEQLYGDLKEDIDPNWGTSPRIVLQYLGTDVFRNDINKIIPSIGNDFWVKLMKIKYQQSLENDPTIKYTISDVRFPNEVKAIHDLGGIVIKIERPGFSNNENDEHESEKNIDLIKDFDELIINDGSLNDLYSKVDELVKKI